MRRYWVDKKFFLEGTVSLEGEVLHHVRDVCRQSMGSKFEILCGDGNAYFVEIIEEEKKRSLCKVLETRNLPTAPKPLIHLCVSIPKLSRLELILEKSVELGVSKVTPFTSEFSFFRDKKKINEKKVDRFKKIIQGATQQSGRGELMELAVVDSLDGLLSKAAASDNVMSIFPYEGVCEKNLKEFLSTADTSKIKEVWLFVGSEGGFSEQEVGKFRAARIQPITVGDQVLRVETACISLVSMLSYELHL